MKADVFDIKCCANTFPSLRCVRKLSENNLTFFFNLTISLQLFGGPRIKYIQGAIKKYRTNETDILCWRLYIRKAQNALLVSV